MNLHTNLPFDHRPARGACRREQCRGGGAGEEAEPSGTARADSTSRQAPATSRPAAGHPSPPPRRRPGARKPRKSELRPEALGSSHPGGSLQPGAHGQFPPWLACSSRSSRIPGKIPLRQESAGPALVPRRQAGACTRGRKPRQTRDALRGHTQGPPRLWLRSRPRPCLGRPRSDSQRKPPPVTPGSHRCAGGCVGCTGRPILSEASQDRAARNSSEPGVLHRTARVEAMSSPLVSSRPYFAISLFFGPSFVNSSFQKTFSLRPPTPSCRLSRRCLAGKGCGSGFRGAGRAKGWR